MFMFVSLGTGENGCSLLTAERKASDKKKTMHVNNDPLNSLESICLDKCLGLNDIQSPDLTNSQDG